MTSASPPKIKSANTIDIRASSDAILQKISREGTLSLTLEEMKAIQNHFKSLKRDPTDIELETIAQTWSEHCYHKTLKASYTYKEENLNGTPALDPTHQKVFTNLLKETIVRATEELNAPWCLSVFQDNAGVIQFDSDTALAFKVETHNHPSALEPYGGAGTGIGGVIRDILGCGLGAKPILNTDIFCFGPLECPPDDLPQGALSPLRIARGVISGVSDYGNRMGIPTANGAVYFDRGYLGNPLVFCGTVGFLPRSAVQKNVEPGDLVVAVGGRTGRDGIHGATFSSAPLEKGLTSKVVQIGHSIMEKKFMDALLAARDKNLYRSITDCGAGGFSSAIGEMGKETGVRVQLEKAPLKYANLAPWEIWLSESQERMVLAVPPENWNSLKLLFEQENVEAVELGVFTSDQKLVATYHGELILDMTMNFLHEGTPKLKFEAIWNPAEHARRHPSRITTPPVQRTDITATLLALLGHPIIASKEVIVRQYDHEVQGGSVIKPFMGHHQDGPTDACVVRPEMTSFRGVAVSNGLNPRLGKWDPYVMAKAVIDEALRNILSVGGSLRHISILDNFCWGDSKDPHELGGLLRAAEGCREAATGLGLPFISGKDSFNNTWKTKTGEDRSIPPTLLVSAIAVVDDVRDCLSPDLKGEGNLIYLIGSSGQTMKGSLAGELWRDEAGDLADVALGDARALYKKMRIALKNNAILSCHDVSDGGVAVTLAEMTFGGNVGLDITLPSNVSDPPSFLFNESPSRFVVEILPSKKEEFEQTIGLRFTEPIGQTCQKPILLIKQGQTALLQQRVALLKKSWKGALHAL